MNATVPPAPERRRAVRPIADATLGALIARHASILRELDALDEPPFSSPLRAAYREREAALTEEWGLVRHELVTAPTTPIGLASKLRALVQPVQPSGDWFGLEDEELRELAASVVD